MQLMRRVHVTDWRTAARQAWPWALSGLLAVVFLSTGVPKLLGGATYWSEAFAMWGYPPWFRIVVGVVETIGGICLLVPRLFLVGVIALSIVLFGATFTQLVSSDGTGAGTPALLLALVLIAAWARKRQPVAGTPR